MATLAPSSDFNFHSHLHTNLSFYRISADAIQFTVDQTALAKSKKADVDAKIGKLLVIY